MNFLNRVWVWKFDGNQSMNQSSHTMVSHVTMKIFEDLLHTPCNRTQLWCMWALRTRVPLSCMNGHWSLLVESKKTYYYKVLSQNLIDCWVQLNLKKLFLCPCLSLWSKLRSILAKLFYSSCKRSRFTPIQHQINAAMGDWVELSWDSKVPRIFADFSWFVMMMSSVSDSLVYPVGWLIDWLLLFSSQIKSEHRLIFPGIIAYERTQYHLHSIDTIDSKYCQSNSDNEIVINENAAAQWVVDGQCGSVWDFKRTCWWWDKRLDDDWNGCD